MKLKSTLLIVSGIVGVEILLFWLYVYGGKPEPSESLVLIIIIPFLFLLNVIVGLFFFFSKARQIAAIVFINSIIAPTIFYFIWMAWFSGFTERYYTKYAFSAGSDKFEIELSKRGNDFTIAELPDQPDGTAYEIYYGKYQVKGDTIALESFANSMFMVNNKLYDFPGDSSAIDLQ